MLSLSRSMLKASRLLLNWSQEQLATKSKIAIGTISRFEAGAGMRQETMERLVQAIQDGGIEFITGDDDPEEIIGLKLRQNQGAKP